MLSTVTGCLCNHKPYGWMHKIAAGLDFLGFITMLVIGILAINGVGNISLGAAGAYCLVAAGALGLIILAAKNIRPPTLDRHLIDEPLGD